MRLRHVVSLCLGDSLSCRVPDMLVNIDQPVNELRRSGGEGSPLLFFCLPRDGAEGACAVGDLGMKGGMIVPERNGGINLKVSSLSLPGAKPRAVEGMESCAKVSVE